MIFIETIDLQTNDVLKDRKIMSERHVDSGVEGLESGKDKQANGCYPTLCKR